MFCVFTEIWGVFFYLRFNVYCSAFADFLGVFDYHRMRWAVGWAFSSLRWACFFLLLFGRFIDLQSVCLSFPIAFVLSLGSERYWIRLGSAFCQQNWLLYLAFTGSN
jgi:hypothetical protein